jgi:hypothetical protein
MKAVLDSYRGMPIVEPRTFYEQLTPQEERN